MLPWPIRDQQLVGLQGNMNSVALLAQEFSLTGIRKANVRTVVGRHA